MNDSKPLIAVVPDEPALPSQQHALMPDVWAQKETNGVRIVKPGDVKIPDDPSPPKVSIPSQQDSGTSKVLALICFLCLLVFNPARATTFTFSVTNDTAYTTAVGMYVSNGVQSFSFYAPTNVSPGTSNVLSYTNATGVYTTTTNQSSWLAGVGYLTPFWNLPNTNGANLSLINSNENSQAGIPGFVTGTGAGSPSSGSGSVATAAFNISGSAAALGGAPAGLFLAPPFGTNGTIYLDPVGGNDTNNGLSEEYPVQSLLEASQIVHPNGTIKCSSGAFVVVPSQIAISTPCSIDLNWGTLYMESALNLNTNFSIYDGNVNLAGQATSKIQIEVADSSNSVVAENVFFYGFPTNGPSGVLTNKQVFESVSTPTGVNMRFANCDFWSAVNCFNLNAAGWTIELDQCRLKSLPQAGTPTPGNCNNCFTVYGAGCLVTLNDDTMWSSNSLNPSGVTGQGILGGCVLGTAGVQVYVNGGSYTSLGTYNSAFYASGTGSTNFLNIGSAFSATNDAGSANLILSNSVWTALADGNYTPTFAFSGNGGPFNLNPWLGGTPTLTTNNMGAGSPCTNAFLSGDDRAMFLGFLTSGGTQTAYSNLLTITLSQAQSTNPLNVTATVGSPSGSVWTNSNNSANSYPLDHISILTTSNSIIIQENGAVITTLQSVGLFLHVDQP